MKNITLIAFIIAVPVSATPAQTPTDNSPEKTAVLANDRAYEAAYARGDAKALAEFYADDVEYTTDDGRTFSGRDAMKECIQAGLEADPGAKLEISVDSVRLLGPEAVLEKGSTRVTSKNGETSDSVYTAIHVKKDGKWKISELIESPSASMTAGDHLAEFSWLIGGWEESDKSDDLSIHSQYLWARGGNFITRNITVKRGEKVTLEGWQIIGWDPVQQCLRSWEFDGEGGFSEGTYTRDNNRWLLRETGVTSDGNRTSGDSTISKISEDRFTWESNNRTLNGDPRPSIGRFEINRVKGN